MLSTQKIIGIVIGALVIITAGLGFRYFRKNRVANSVEVNKLEVSYFSLDEKASNYLGKAIKKGKGVSIILFFRDTCPFCREFLPTFDKLAKQQAKLGASFGAVQMDNNRAKRDTQKKQIKKKFGISIRTFPYILIVKDGAIVQVLEGDKKARSEKNIKKILKKLKK